MRCYLLLLTKDNLENSSSHKTNKYTHTQFDITFHIDRIKWKTKPDAIKK